MRCGIREWRLSEAHLLLDGEGEASEAWDDALAVAEAADWPAWEFGF